MYRSHVRVLSSRFVFTFGSELFVRVRCSGTHPVRTSNSEPEPSTEHEHELRTEHPEVSTVGFWYSACMAKRVFLFVLTNIAIVLTLSIVVSLLGLNQGYRGGNLDIG